MNNDKINLVSNKKISNTPAVVESLFDKKIAGKWLTSREAAEYLSITENALRIMVCRKLIQAKHLGRRLRFKKSDLDSVLSIRKD